jgi:cyclic beta-1,2-glucan synthetase
MAIRARIRLEAGESATVSFTTLVAPTRERAWEMADRYDDPSAAQRALDLAWTTAQVELRELNLTPADAAVYQAVAGHLFYANRSLAAPDEERLGCRGSQPLLWSVGVSGDWPILLASIDSMEGLSTLRQLLSAHRYWRRRGMQVDLVVLDTHPPTYQKEVRDRITATVLASTEGGGLDHPGGVFVRRVDLLAPEVLTMLRATARVIVPCDGRSLGRLLEQLSPEDEAIAQPEPSVSTLRRLERSTPQVFRAIKNITARLLESDTPPDGSEAVRKGRSKGEDLSTEELQAPLGPPLRMDNGIGGLTDAGDYEIRLRGGMLPPAPWANVVANPRAGFVVTERGGGFSWAENSFFYRLTPWHNDPVSDPVSDVLYLRDEDSGDLWSATPAPIRHHTPYVVRHGAAVSSFEHEHNGIATRLTLGVAPEDPVKLSLLEVTNRGTKSRKLTVTSYVEWTLGVLREHTRHQVQTAFDPVRRAILARNTFDPQFADRIAFCAMSEPVTGHTGDRREFLGRNGSATAPLALSMDIALEG